LISETAQPEVTDEEIEEFVKLHKFYAHFKCSAKNGHNIKTACHHLVLQIAENAKDITTDTIDKEQLEDKPTAPVVLGGESPKKSEGGSGCCG